ncbi:MAG: ABC transporter ATP-binding protein [Fulvimarina manganoxydans]|uniref:ABC transporter ATP-binding protein n=1 Tax=Fulvimarina manganoxydans TaxID=937218 RepID=UPI002356D7F6|nr:ABC transporter ATP-binding protein [Fulvimarina manganoxydans]MCK5930958.1 ABC transporter ATP-binding protein [Fulvimarina manganoxydans]
MAATIRIEGLNKLFEGANTSRAAVKAVDHVDLEIKAGELVTLLGPSGCGKTTLLRMIAGFEEPTSGDIHFGDKRINDLPPNRRDAAMVFQSYAIFPHLDVFENVAFGLRLKKLAADEIAERVHRVLGQTGLADYGKRSPNQLSGGQQQRVALARAIVMEPSVLLFDEPLSNLDAKLRDQMRIEIRDLQQRVGITSIYVTHDQIEAMSMSDRIVVMNKGRIEQIGAPADIYSRPVSRFVAEFIGKANFSPVEHTPDGQASVLGVPVTARADMPGDAVAVVRPEAVRLTRGAGGRTAIVRRSTFLGSVAEYLIELADGALWLVDDPNPSEHGLYKVGETVTLHLSKTSIHVLDASRLAS